MAQNTAEKTLGSRNYWYLFLLGGILLNFPFDGLIAFTGTLLLAVGMYKLSQVLIKTPNLGGTPRSDRIIRTGLAVVGVFLVLSVRVVLGLTPSQ
jgi:hypothetical protein